MSGQSESAGRMGDLVALRGAGFSMERAFKIMMDAALGKKDAVQMLELAHQAKRVRDAGEEP